MASQLQVFVYKLPALPGTSLGQSRGYSVTDTPLSAPVNSTAHTPSFGGGGLAATEGAEFVYVGSPAAPQGTPQLTLLYGNSAVYVFRASSSFLQQHLSEVPGLASGFTMSSDCLLSILSRRH